MPEEVDAMQPLRHTLPPDGRREFAEEQPQQRDDGASVDHPSTETPNVGGGAGGSRNRFRRLLSLMASPLTDETGSPISVVAGMCTLIAVGAAIGLALPKNPALPTVAYRSVSAAIGWVYFLAWSVSFYPQLISNWKRRSTVGLSPDFCVLNVLGFACYAAYNVAFFWSTTIQDLYRKRHGEDAEITVQANDVAFALHAFLLSSITVLQILYYGGGLGALRLSKPIQWVIVAIFVVCTMYTVLVADFTTTQIRNDTARRYHDDSIGRFNWLDFLYLLSFVKIGISLIKYIPQVILNYRRKSTVGWSIWNILLDFTGGVLSDLQVSCLGWLVQLSRHICQYNVPSTNILSSNTPPSSHDYSWSWIAQI